MIKKPISHQCRCRFRKNAAFFLSMNIFVVLIDFIFDRFVQNRKIILIERIFIIKFDFIDRQISKRENSNENKWKVKEKLTLTSVLLEFERIFHKNSPIIHWLFPILINECVKLESLRSSNEKSKSIRFRSLRKKKFFLPFDRRLDFQSWVFRWIVEETHWYRR